MFKHLTVLLSVALLTVACTGDGEESPLANPSPCPSPSAAIPEPDPPFAEGRAILEGDEGSVLLRIEIAEQPSQQAQGLMFRECLRSDSGMAFIFFEATDTSFYMKDTLIPLSIAFFDDGGEILRILDMEPCTEEPCELYDPGVTFNGALEVNQGSFDEWGIEEGDSIRITQNDRNPF